MSFQNMNRELQRFEKNSNQIAQEVNNFLQNQLDQTLAVDSGGYLQTSDISFHIYTASLQDLKYMEQCLSSKCINITGFKLKLIYYPKSRQCKIKWKSVDF